MHSIIFIYIDIGYLVGEPVHSNFSITGGVDIVINSVIELDSGTQCDTDMLIIICLCVK